MKDFNNNNNNNGNTREDDDTKPTGLHGQRAALQLICLGSGGGPGEDNTAGFLVRSVGREWARGSMLAVDAGSHLAPIARILERDFPAVSEGRELSGWRNGREEGEEGQGDGGRTPGLSGSLAQASLSPESGESLSPSPSPLPEPTVLSQGPFAGLKFPNLSARANAAHVVRAYVSTYLITHPHLDHLAGFAINTAAFHGGTRPKTLAALPSTVEAVKQHIFNDIIWPNLTDEDGGVGFVTFQRLKEGGDPMIGEGEGRGYIDVCDGLGVRAFKVSHGTCTKSPPSHHHRGSRGSVSGATTADSQPSDGRHISTSQTQHASFSTPGTPGGPLATRQSTTSQLQPQNPAPPISQQPAPDPPGPNCVVDSTAFFIRDCDTAREVLVFGDVEPDSISLTPRNALVWAEAARKIAANLLGGIFIECSYDDSQADSLLFGHLCPRHLYAELRVLAGMVVEARALRAQEKAQHGHHKKRKRSAATVPNGLEGTLRADESGKRSRSLAGRHGRTLESRLLRRSSADHSMPDATPTPPTGIGGGATAPSTAMTSRQHSPDPSSLPPASPKTVLKTPQQPNFGSSAAAAARQQPQHQQPQFQHPSQPLTSEPTQYQPSSQPSQQQQQQQQNPPNQYSSSPDGPLAGIKIVIIHIKDTLRDGPHVSETILSELQDHERAAWEEQNDAAVRGQSQGGEEGGVDGLGLGVGGNLGGIGGGVGGVDGSGFVYGGAGAGWNAAGGSGGWMGRLGCGFEIAGRGVEYWF